MSVTSPLPSSCEGQTDDPDRHEAGQGRNNAAPPAPFEALAATKQIVLASNQLPVFKVFESLGSRKHQNLSQGTDASALDPLARGQRHSHSPQLHLMRSLRQKNFFFHAANAQVSGL